MASATTTARVYLVSFGLVGSAVVIHELGHAVVGRLVGSRVLTISIGVGPRLARFRALGANVELENVVAGAPVVVRANYYPAWRAFAAGREVPLYSSEGQIAFRAPQSGTYTVRFEYPRYRWLSILALIAAAAGIWIMTRLPLVAGR